MNHVLISGAIHEKALALLDARADVSYEMVEDTEAAVAAKLPEADGLLIRIATLGAQAIGAAGRLKVVSRHGVGYDSIAVDALTARGIPLTVIGTANSLSVAEHAIFLMLALAKRGFAFDQAVRANEWATRNRLVGLDLSGKTLLIVGLGRIGRRVAKRLLAFDMNVIAYDPYVDEATMREHGVKKIAELNQGLQQADIVTLHAPRTPETENIIGAEQLALMKSSAILINTARGGLIDETALYETLKAGRLFGAGIDVLDREPPAADHPLLTLDNIILSPHTAATTKECMERMGVTAAQNVLAGLDGRLDPEMVVNQEVLS